MKKLIIFLSLFMSLFSNIHSDESLVSEIFLKRHSGKNYDPYREVSFNQLHALIEAARWTPSSYNEQPWSFIICDRNTTPLGYEVGMSSLLGNQQLWAKNAPILIILTAKTNLSKNNKPNEWALYDAGAAAMSLSLQASELGLMAHQIGGFDKELIKKEFKVPNNQVPVTLIALGYESGESDPNPKPRERKDIADNFFLGEWGLGFIGKE